MTDDIIEPIAVVFTPHHGRYRVEFDYDPAAVALLKATVPGAMRRWAPKARCWEISTDWVGPLASAFVNAGIEVVGLNHTNRADWFSVFSAAMPTNPSGHDAYRKGLCKSCESTPRRPGGVECDDCYQKRLTYQHRVKAVLAEAGAARYPEAVPAGGDARTTRYPLEVDRIDIAVTARDYAEVADILIAAEYEATRTCPICGRKPPKDKMIHTTCRTRLLHALDEDRPFTRARNEAYQNGACTVCRARPYLTGGVACARCARVLDACRSLRCVD